MSKFEKDIARVFGGKDYVSAAALFCLQLAHMFPRQRDFVCNLK